MHRRLVDRVQLILVLVIIVTVVGAYLGISQRMVDQVVLWLVSLLIGAVMSFLAGSLVEAATGDWLKRVSIQWEIAGRPVSVSLFVIVTLLVRFLLFK